MVLWQVILQFNVNYCLIFWTISQLNLVFHWHFWSWITTCSQVLNKIKLLWVNICFSSYVIVRFIYLSVTVYKIFATVLLLGLIIIIKCKISLLISTYSTVRKPVVSLLTNKINITRVYLMLWKPCKYFVICNNTQHTYLFPQSS